MLRPDDELFRWALDGFSDAVERWDDARSGVDRRRVFIALHDTLAWLFTLAESSQAESSAELFLGFRRARAAVQHHLADAIDLREGAQFPLNFSGGGVTFFEWRWRDESELPLPERHPLKDQREAYRRDLAGRPVRVTLEPVQEWVARHGAHPARVN